MKKFTFISEYKGGTYIDQYESLNIYDALIFWQKKLDNTIYAEHDIELLSKEIQLEDYKPTPINGIENVWCCVFLSGDSFLLLNIIETV